MSQKIILFLSELKENSASRSYHCPDGSQVEGAQTNEAPVQYLLRRYPDTTEILCIVTEKAEGAFASLSEKWGQLAPGVSAVPIPYEEGEEFSGAPLSAILSHVRPGDEILLETTGGFRNAVMYLLLLGRILSYTGVRTVCAVYSNFQTSEIEDISSIVSLFDLVGGMQELTSFGSVRTLRTYYGDNPADPAIGELLSSLERLNDAILLCRTRQIDGCMESFGKALDGVEHCSDPLMRELVPAFRKKFGKKMSIISLIKWCVESDMLQQALTVYTERVPAVILERGDLLRMGPGVRRVTAMEYQDPAAEQFLKGFLKLSSNSFLNPVQMFRRYMQNHAGDVLRHQRGEFVRYPREILTALCNIELIASLAYGKSGSCFDPMWMDKLPKEKSFLRKLEEVVNQNPPASAQSMLNKIGVCPELYIWVLLEENNGEETKAESDYVQTLRHLEELLPRSGYEAVCLLEQIGTVCRDYLYIKALRNLTNHANDEKTSDQAELMGYLSEFGYPPMEQVTSRDIKQILLQAVKHMMPQSKKERK